jgi:hypothetical protein
MDVEVQGFGFAHGRHHTKNAPIGEISFAEGVRRGPLRTASPQIKRQVFASFDLQLAYDKAEGRVEIKATISETVAEALENAKTLLAEGSSVVVTDIGLFKEVGGPGGA